MGSTPEGLVSTLTSLPVFHAEWVLWLLIALSLASIGVMLERVIFYRRRAIDVDALRKSLSESLGRGDFPAAVTTLEAHDTLETNVVLFGLRDYARGADAVEDLLSGATQKEKERYDQRLSFLATIASNAPFIGLFGTVLGIIRSFKDLSGNIGEASSAVMAGIAEALIATAVGLLVAIPAVVAFNYFKAKVKRAMNNTHLLSKVLLSHLKTVHS
ncbi:MAG: MotA/TolQ/ExbB proton channel family protein [Deltaproteobacteria bacterium]|nr:MotA/TolQ/ExbB proton channel family protein [Deltaproteobacteria bacterium]